MSAVALESPGAGGLGFFDELAVAPAIIDEYTGDAECPQCHREPTIGTPHVPVELLVDDDLVLDLQAAGADGVPVFGWRCRRHRRDVVLPAPFDEAPTTFDPVEADLGEQRLTLAVPRPFLTNVRA